MLCLMLGLRDWNKILLVYHPPHCLTLSLPELTQVALGVVLGTPKLVVLGDFNISPTEKSSSERGQSDDGDPC